GIDSIGGGAMVERNLYVVLGVDPTESAQGIRAAFRDLAKRYHPDRVGEGGAAAFHEIAEAYRVLSDSEERRYYDDSLERSRRAERGMAWAEAEPLIPESTSLRRGAGAIGPSADALFDRMARNFNGIHVPKAERLEALDVQLVMSPADAASGGIYRIGVPI